MDIKVFELTASENWEQPLNFLIRFLRQRDSWFFNSCTKCHFIADVHTQTQAPMLYTDRHVDVGERERPTLCEIKMDKEGQNQLQIPTKA